MFDRVVHSRDPPHADLLLPGFDIETETGGHGSSDPSRKIRPAPAGVVSKLQKKIEKTPFTK
jgi:hypothetical protein